MSLASAASRNKHLPGFSLLEMIAVMAIVALLASMSVPRLVAKTGASHVRAAAFQMAAQLRQTRMAALKGTSRTVFTVDTGARKALGASKNAEVISIPDIAEITHQVSSRCEVEGNVVKVIFLPDGRSCGSQISLTMDGLVATIQTDWLTGKSKVSFR